MPGIVGMHNHLFYIARPDLDSQRHFDPPVLAPQMTFSAPRLYLAGGVTTMRTTGSMETYTDLNLKHDIDAGKLPGPHLDVTGPYLEGSDQLLHPDAAPDQRRRRAANCGVLGRPGRDLVQGVHEHHPRRVEGRDRRGAPARH